MYFGARNKNVLNLNSKGSKDSNTKFLQHLAKDCNKNQNRMLLNVRGRRRRHLCPFQSGLGRNDLASAFTFTAAFTYDRWHCTTMKDSLIITRDSDTGTEHWKCLLGHNIQTDRKKNCLKKNFTIV